MTVKLVINNSDSNVQKMLYQEKDKVKMELQFYNTGISQSYILKL